MAFRRIELEKNNIIGKPITYKGVTVGHIVDVNRFGGIIVTTNNDELLSHLMDNTAEFSLEVIDK